MTVIAPIRIVAFLMSTVTFVICILIAMVLNLLTILHGIRSILCGMVVFQMLEFEWKEIFLTLILLIILEGAVHSGVLKSLWCFLKLLEANL